MLVGFRVTNDFQFNNTGLFLWDFWKRFQLVDKQQEGRFNYFGYQREFHIVAFYIIVGLCVVPLQNKVEKQS